MGVGPAVAIPAAVKAAGLEVDDIDLFEINEVSLFLINILGNIFSYFMQNLKYQ
jgi:Thiolase, C-terminal domain